VSASCLVPRWSRPRQLHRPPCARRKRACLCGIKAAHAMAEIRRARASRSGFSSVLTQSATASATCRFRRRGCMASSRRTCEAIE
jgi:hypothetical protein